MEKSKIFIFFLAVYLFTACENDLDLVAPHQDIPIVYGLICPNDTVQYIRLEKAFIDKTLAPSEIAQIPDSLYYPFARVLISNLGSGKQYEFDMVDAAGEGFPRDEGFFAQEPNYIYKLSTSGADFQIGQEYELQVITGEERIAAASTRVLEPPLITRPSSSSRLDFNSSNDFIIKWNPDEFAQFSDVYLLIHYEEIDQSSSNPAWVPKILQWNVETLVEDREISRKGEEFYSMLESRIPEDTHISRMFTGIDVYVNSGGEELFNYISAGQANLGLSSSLEIPQYTNLSSGFGIFAAKSTAFRKNLQLTPRSLDSLRTGQYTRDLNFL